MSIQALWFANHPVSQQCFSIVTVRRTTKDIQHVQLVFIELFCH